MASAEACPDAEAHWCCASVVTAANWSSVPAPSSSASSCSRSCRSATSMPSEGRALSSRICAGVASRNPPARASGPSRLRSISSSCGRRSRGVSSVGPCARPRTTADATGSSSSARSDAAAVGDRSPWAASTTWVRRGPPVSRAYSAVSCDSGAPARRPKALSAGPHPSTRLARSCSSSEPETFRRGSLRLSWLDGRGAWSRSRLGEQPSARAASRATNWLSQSRMGTPVRCAWSMANARVQASMSSGLRFTAAVNQLILRVKDKLSPTGYPAVNHVG